MNPKVTALVPVYCGITKYLKRAILIVLSQIYKDLELSILVMHREKILNLIK